MSQLLQLGIKKKNNYLQTRSYNTDNIKVPFSNWRKKFDYLKSIASEIDFRQMLEECASLVKLLNNHLCDYCMEKDLKFAILKSNKKIQRQQYDMWNITCS